MIKITIDNKEIEVAQGATILAAATESGIHIPTLCYLESCGVSGSCMVCAVQNLVDDRMIPACAARCEDGMKIDASSQKVLDFRRGVLELLLNEHRGDCQAPCQLACPKGIDISKMLHLFVQGKREAAAELLPEIKDICTDCGARCEKACRRGRYDKAIAISKIIADLIDTKKENKNIAENKSDSYSHHFGMVSEDDMELFIKTKNNDDSISEAARCLRCDCRAADDCQLRHLSSEYDATQKHFGKSSIKFKRVYYGKIGYEVGKCIKCANCISVGERVKPGFGPVFSNRGEALTVASPIGVDKDKLFNGIEEECLKVCPTGALFWREDQ